LQQDAFFFSLVMKLKQPVCKERHAGFAKFW